MIGAKTICVTEKHEMPTPIMNGGAPSRVRYSGRDDIAMPSPSIWQKTANVMGTIAASCSLATVDSLEPPRSFEALAAPLVFSLLLVPLTTESRQAGAL